MNEYLKKVIDWTDCNEEDVTEVYSKDERKIYVVAYTDDDGYCHCYLIRCWLNMRNEIDLSVDFENCTRVEDAQENIAMICKELARVI